MSEQKEKKDYLIVKLIAGVIIGLLIGLKCDEKSIQVFMSIKQILGQIIFYAVPLVIVGFITPAITGLKQNANKLLTTALIIAYVSSIGAAFMSMIAGYIIIPNLNIVSDVAGTKELPDILFSLSIPPMFPVMTALVTSIIFGLAIIWTKSELMEKLFIEFNNIMMLVVQKIVVPILPFFVASTFATLAYEGAIIHQFPVFIKAIIIVMVMHYIWLAVLYGIGGTISKSNPFEVLKHYGPAYLTAVGTMSSAATLPVSLECARKSSVLDREIVDFAIPIGATIHLCGSVLTEVFFVMTVSKILTGSIPPIGTMVVFILLLGIFAIGAPGVPGGTVMASLGIIISVLGFDQSGTALMLTIFALQDSFGTACNVTGDGAIALMLTGLYKKQK